MYRKFKPLNIPDGWEQYWSKYPNGYSILEALIEWVSQVDDMVENQNELTDTVKSFGERIDEFIDQFGAELQATVTDILQEWQNSGFLEVIISEALQWQLDDYIATNEADKLSMTTQLQHTEQELKIRGIRPEDFGAVGDGVTDDTLAVQEAINWASTNRSFVLLQKKYAYTQLTLNPGTELRGLHQSETQIIHIGIGESIYSGATGNNLYFKASNFTIQMNQNTAVGLNLTGMAMYRVDNLNVFGNGSLGVGVRCGMDANKVKAGYYNTFNDCYIQGIKTDNTIGLSIGFEMIDSANSTRFYNCRFDYVSTCIYGEYNTNNNLIMGCSFEHFNKGVHTEGRAYDIFGSRFELPTGSTDQVAFHITGAGFYNHLFGCHFQNVPNKVLDETTNKLNTYFADYVGNVQQLVMNNYPLQEVKTLGFVQHDTYLNTKSGEMVYLNDVSNKGLYFRDGSSLRPFSFVRASSSAGRPTDVPTGTMFYDNTLQKPIWWTGTAWKDATGASIS